MSVIITDRDAVIACAGVSKKEYNDKQLSDALENIIEGRNMYVWREGSDKIHAIADSTSCFVSCAMPIISEGDVIGCVASLCDANGSKPRENITGDIESKLVLTAAGFLGRQLEA